VNIYLDTNLWNALCDHPVDPHDLVALLAARNASLVFSLQTFHELCKTFRASTTKSFERGKKLFSYFQEFVDADIPCAKEIMELLAAEMWALNLGKSTVDAFLNKKDYAEVRREVNKLANGEYDERTANFLEERATLASSTRLGQARHLESRSDIKQNLMNVSPESLEKWLNYGMTTPGGVALLVAHIQRQFPEAPQLEAEAYAPELLALPANGASRGLVRADLYYNWRCAHRDSNPKDLLDDMYHVLESVHCDVYATAETGQREYAGLLLTANTRVAIYDGRMPPDRWLEGLACGPSDTLGTV
jgi:hypothetical protein